MALLRSPEEFLAWLIFDPRAAVARLKQVPIDPKVELSAGRPARFQVGGTLARSREARWRTIWNGFIEMSELTAPGPGLW